MNKQILYISIGLFCTAVIFFILVPQFLKMGNYSRAKDETSCKTESESQMKKDPKKCAFWDGSQCRKAQNVGIFCIPDQNFKPLIFMIAGFTLLFVSIVTFIISKITKKCD